MKFLVRKRSFCLKIIIAFSSLFLIMALNIRPARAADIGGKLSLISNLTYTDSKLDNSLQTELELEWFLPYDFPLNIQNRAVFTLSESGEDKFELWFKKLYLKEKLKAVNISLGRQPISWSYGALINPVDYSLGAENLEEESRAKFVDGLELYYPINWGSGLTFVASNLEDQKDHKWALRGRTTFRGYDLSLSYVNTPLKTTADLERYGLTFKGDLGPVGVYGAYGLWQSEEIDYDIYQLGTDYSYNFLRGSQLYLQGEYLRLENIKEEINSFNFFSFNSKITAKDNLEANNYDFINTNLSYNLDEFTTISLITVSYLKDGSTIFIPKYSYFLSSNLLLELKLSLGSGKKEEVFAADSKALEINLSYTF